MLMDDTTIRLRSAFLTELRDPKKATTEHLNSQNDSFSWKMVTEEERTNGLNTHASNDPCKYEFGVLIDQITIFNNISLANADGMEVTDKNRDFNSGHKKIGKSSKFVLIIQTLSQPLLRTSRSSFSTS